MEGREQVAGGRCLQEAIQSLLEIWMKECAAEESGSGTAAAAENVPKDGQGPDNDTTPPAFTFPSPLKSPRASGPEAVDRKFGPCQVCGKTFRHKRNLTRHVYTHTGERPFQCHLCPMAFREKYRLSNHLGSHCDQKPFICCACGKGFTRKSCLEDHERMHAGDKPFRCDVCGLRYTQKRNLTRHRKEQHPGNAEFLQQQQILLESVIEAGLLEETSSASRGKGDQFYGKTFPSGQQHQNHLYTNTGERPYKCHRCPKAYKRSHHLNRHLRSHSDEKQLSPPLGGLAQEMQLSTEETAGDSNFVIPDMATQLPDEQTAPGNLSYFEILVSEQENLLQLEELIEMEVFLVSLHYVENTPAVSMENNYVEVENLESVPNDGHVPDSDIDLPNFLASPSAGSSASSLESLTKGTRKRGLNFGPCHFCGKMFQSSQNLQRHEYTHTGERPHKCHLCPKAFKQKGHLDTHLRSHSGQKPFTCPECGKAFSKKLSLENHERRHAEAAKPFGCDVCGRTFTGGDYLKMHLKRKHPSSADPMV